MKQSIYPRLAWHGVAKNKQIYLPFLLTCIGIFAVYYIVSYLTYSASVREMQGGKDLQMVLSWGTAVVAIFAVIFLFYMNSFLMRRRKTEFGLYNILGMGKWNLARILVLQTIMLLVTSLAGGLGLGILLSKLAELLAARTLNTDTPLGFTVEPNAVRNVILLALIAFGLILLYSLGQIHVSRPVELLRGEKAGERPPKVRWLPAVLGVLLLSVAYFLAIRTTNPISALLVLFLAVALVVLGTYLLFLSGSVALCHLLRKNKKYYYQTNHFISVSSMAYRMKRNGASLASICIFSTFVLVMMSTTLCLRIGSEDSLHQRYPKSFEVTCGVDDFNKGDAADQYLTQRVQQALEQSGKIARSPLRYRSVSFAGVLKENKLLVRPMSEISDYQHVVEVTAVTLDTYNRLAGALETLSQNEAMLFEYRGNYRYDTIQIDDLETLHIAKQVESFLQVGDNIAASYPTIYLIVPDDAALKTLYDCQRAAYQEIPSRYTMYYGFDLNSDEEQQMAFYNTLQQALAEGTETIDGFSYSVSCREEARSSFYSLFGGMLYLGALLSLVFLFGTVLIMYYKQISEGYEDAARFEILQKVGMTKQEIRRSINSQILTVFAAPLLMAGIHICFAFPLLRRILLMFGLSNAPLFMIVTAGSFLVFALLYIVMYKTTSHSYYQLVKKA